MVDLFGPSSRRQGVAPQDEGKKFLLLNERKIAVKAALTIADVSDLLGLDGMMSGAANGVRMGRGNDVVVKVACPKCSDYAIAREDGRGFRCQCGNSGDVIDLAMQACDVRYATAVNALYAEVVRRDAKRLAAATARAVGQKDLF